MNSWFLFEHWLVASIIEVALARQQGGKGGRLKKAIQGREEVSNLVVNKRGDERKKGPWSK
jgi:hypothetical protein